MREACCCLPTRPSSPGDKQHLEALNAIITQPSMTIEGKGKDTVQAPSFIHLLMASNENWVVPSSLDARRFFVLDVTADKKRDREYFKHSGPS